MKIAITGSMGAGKSFLSAYLKEQGYRVEDMDQWVHELYKDPQIIRHLEDMFQENLNVNGAVDRKRLNEVLFSNEDNLAKLESYIHPLVYKKVSTLPENTFVEVPLLFESDGQEFFDAIICVDAPYKIREERLIKRGMRKEDILSRNNRQYPVDKKIELSDYVIINNEDLPSLKSKIDTIVKELGI